MADNDQLLKQIAKLLEAEREQTKKIVREENEAVEKRLTAKIDTVDMKVEAFNHKLDTTAKEIKEEIKGAIEREAEVITDLFHETWDRMDVQDERITRLEKHTNLPYPNKN